MYMFNGPIFISVTTEPATEPATESTLAAIYIEYG